MVSAWNHDELPNLATAGGPGSGWAAWHFTTDGAILATELNIQGVTGSAQAGAYLFDANDNLLFGIAFTALGASDDGTLVDVNTPVPGLNVHQDTTSPSAGGGSMGIGMTFNDPAYGAGQAGDYKLVLWGAGGASWDAALRGTTGDALLGTTSGASAFLYGADDFRGVANVQSYQDGAGASAEAATTKTIDIAHRFIGVAYDAQFKFACALVCAGGPGTAALSAQGPNDLAPTPCYCGFYGEGAAGTYTFSLSGADASAGQAVFACQPAPVLGYACAGAFALNDFVIVGGVDAELPA